MNEQIKELAKQCENWYEVSDDFLEMEFDVEKFAGLFQYEIIKIIESCYYRDGSNSPHNLALNLVIKEIKEHFGV
jgi:hypothetical protein